MGLIAAGLPSVTVSAVTVDGAFDRTGSFVARTVYDLVVVGRGGVPASGVGSVALNVTVTNPTVAGFVTVWPTGQPQPTASNLNFVPGQTVPNMVIVPVGVGGQVSIFSSAGTVDVIVDVLGWFPTGSSFTGLTPARLMDTRAGFTTIDTVFAGAGALAARTPSDLVVVGRGGVPASGVGSVALNVTVTNPTVAGFLTVWPTGQPQPTASNLNFVPGQTVPNMVIVPVGAGGQVSIFSSAGTVDVIVDVLGWFPTASSFTGLTPARLMDTRVTPVAVSSGYGHSCVLLDTGRIKCWGLDLDGQLGDGRPSIVSRTPVAVIGITNATAIATGRGHSCALLADATIKCWGANTHGQLGNGLAGSYTPVVVAGITNATAIATGTDHSCALLADATIKCWGDNGAGELGSVTTTVSPFTGHAASLTPVAVTGITNATAIATGWGHSCALLADATIKCWGANTHGQLGFETGTFSSATPVVVTGVTNATAIAAGDLHSCALLADATIKCWGLSNYFIGDQRWSAIPSTVTGITTAISVSAGGLSNSCAVLSTGIVKCWGEGERGALGNGAETFSAIPVTVVDLGPVAAVTIGNLFACALLTNATISCWGNNEKFGQLGIGTSTFFSTRPVAVTGF